MINSISDPLLRYIKDDPVRPNLSTEFRVTDNRIVLALVDQDDLDIKVRAMCCVSFHDSVPQRLDDLLQTSDSPSICLFYTIWSYVAGAGRTLIFEAVRHIQETRPNIHRFVTLSPKTDMARRFHIRNGAVVFRENPETVNYEYVNS
jgi:hypothetical protein